ncbi:MAG: MBL fold metallo-hydrolase [Clostridiales bacterium]|nr:MBL fold metallo-hydrolase [Clostridiales bacterium]
MKLHVLGVSGPFPESNGATSGYLLQADDTLIQFDLGSGVLSRLTAKTAPEGLSALFLSHWHFDHAADLPVLMYRLEALGFGKGGKVLDLYAPADDSSALRRVAAAAACFRLRDVAPGDTVQIGPCVISAGEARHPVPAVGFRVECGGRVLGYTGDTNTLPSLAGFYRGCHLLLADGLFPSEAWAEQKPHLSAALAASLAKEAGAERLVLTHLNPFFPPEILLREARENHPDVSLAAPGQILPV